MKTKYTVDENFFAKIDTEEKAYWLGFIIADGCLPPLRKEKPRRLTICLAVCDTTHLEKMRTAIKYTGPLYFSKSNPGRFVGKLCKKMPEGGYEQVTLSVGRKAFVGHLLKQGVTPRKTFTAAPPDGNVPDDLLRHYWRGLFDGDGTVIKTNRSTGAVEWALGVCGNKAICDGFAAFSKKEVGIPIRSVPSQTIWKAMVAGTQVPQLVAHLLYDRATVFLDRKKVLIDELFQVEPGKKMRVMIGGKAVRISDLAKTSRFTKVTISRRISLGMSPEKAATADVKPPPGREPELYSHNGRSMAISQWAKEVGVKDHIIRRRLMRGDTFERAIRPRRNYRYTKPASTTENYDV